MTVVRRLWFQHPMSSFSSSPGFSRFLDRTRKADVQERWAARNFLLDSSVPDARRHSYDRAGAAVDFEVLDHWWAAHEDYLVEQVQLPNLAPMIGAAVDPDDPDLCPEPFRAPAVRAPYSETSLGISLMRLEELLFIADRGGLSVERAREILEAAETSPADADALLATLAERSDVRPRFCGFWAELEDLFVDGVPSPGWADRARDRLGLGHLDPGARGGPIEVVLFRYDVGEVPGITGWAEVPLVAPTVLDGALSQWFCPAPSELAAGRTVSLSYDGEAPAEEVLHPANRLRAHHVRAIGTITEAVKTEELPILRSFHIEWVRELSGLEDWAATTDGDLK